MRPRARQAPKRDAKVILLSLPASERVPPLILRLITRWRRLRSAALLSGGVSGWETKTNNSLMCRDVPLNPPAQFSLDGRRVLQERAAQPKQPPFQRQLLP